MNRGSRKPSCTERPSSSVVPPAPHMGPHPGMARGGAARRSRAQTWARLSLLVALSASFLPMSFNYLPLDLPFSPYFSSSAFCKFIFMAFFRCHRPAGIRGGIVTGASSFQEVQTHPVSWHPCARPRLLLCTLQPLTARQPSFHLPSSSVFLPCQCSTSLTDFSITSGV